MPIYEYRCHACGQTFSRFFRSITAAERATVTCPACGSTEVRRRVSRVAVHSGARAQAEEPPAPEPERPPVFGRKELQEIMRQREQWQQEVEAGK